jgi:hypothetical protein
MKRLPVGLETESRASERSRSFVTRPITPRYASLVSMMKSTNVRTLHDAPFRRRLDTWWRRPACTKPRNAGNAPAPRCMRGSNRHGLTLAGEDYVFDSIDAH